jgi:hypothetical protein
MRDKQRWAGTATELWKALNELVDEDVRHTKAWPGAPNSLTNRLKRLAPALRDIGIEYGEERSGSKGTRLKTLTKLDFSHFWAKGVGYALVTHPLKERRSIAYPTDHDDTSFGPVRAIVLKECLAARSSARSRRNPSSRTENRKLRSARDGFGSRAALSSLP